MGAKTCLVAHVNGDARRILAAKPTLDEVATADLVASVFRHERFGAPTGADLTCTYVRKGEVVAGCFPGLCIVAASEVAIDRPAQLPARFISPKGKTILHAMHSVTDWFAFACWEDGVLRRSLSVAPDDGVIEDLGKHLPFEEPYWKGEHPAVDPEEEPSGYPLPFRPLELGEAALRELFGFQLEGDVDSSLVEPEHVRLLKFETSNSKLSAKMWWKFW